VIVALHKDRSLWYYWQPIGAGGWNPEQVAGPAAIRQASVTQVGNWSAIGAVDTMDGLSVFWQQIDATGWVKIPVPGGEVIV
jgi:hypothetical protein